MGMEFPEPPDMEQLADEKKKAEEAKNRVITEDECWEFKYSMQKYDPSGNDNGIRKFFKNTMSGKWRMMKEIRFFRFDEKNRTPLIGVWDWDGDAYNLN